uniref:Uncharacterized protein n=1 Tax=viral metagenome TaxID=1070528 RepID=A0A6M3KCX3_9ZZZZ
MPDNYDKFLGIGDGMSDVELGIFKRVFLGDDGQYVLGRILEKCKFMEPCDNERDMALNNFAKELLATIYWDRDKKGVNIHRIMSFVRETLRRRK